MPSSYKEAILTPLLKKPDLNAEDLKNYESISNLSYVSKLIEKVVAKEITNYVSTNYLEGKCFYDEVQDGNSSW